MGFLMPQSAAASDIDISDGDGTNSISPRLVETIRNMDGVRQVYGRRSLFDISAKLQGSTAAKGTDDGGTGSSITVDLVSLRRF